MSGSHKLEDPPDVTGNALSEIARVLEEAGENGDLDQMMSDLPKLEREFERLRKTILEGKSCVS